MNIFKAITFALSALAISGCNSASERYQIVASNNVVYRIDTQTGEVVAGWLGKDEGQVIIPAGK